MINFCTLFDSGYMDRGIVLYKSLEKYADEFCLYILCLDELAFRTLKKMEFQDAVIIPEAAILDEVLAEIKRERHRSEYCWTCTPLLVEYVLEYFPVRDCTYIDADMMFYGNPQVLLDELYAEGASVGIIGHRFPENIAKNKRERYYGKYCVEFNTFLNDDRGRRVLKDWKESCLKQCTMELGEDGFGDQKYLEKWENKFEGVYEYRNVGAGVAPWNISDYRPETLGEIVQLIYRRKTKCKLLFYHFQSLMVLADDQVFIGVYNELGVKSKKMINYLYQDYALKLMEARERLKEYGVKIPLQELRKGEKSSISKMSLKDFFIFCCQCIPGIIDRKRNYLDINELEGKME